MPKINHEPLDKRSASLSPTQWSELEELAEKFNLSTAEVLRQAVAEGVLVMQQKLIAALEYRNKKLVNQKLQHRQDRTFRALADLKSLRDQWGDIGALANIYEQLEQCLTD